MSKLKVVQLLPELNIGGVERGTKDFSKALIENGHESIVISNGGIFEEDIIKSGGKHIKLPIHKKSFFSFKSVGKYSLSRENMCFLKFIIEFTSRRYTPRLTNPGNLLSFFS